MQKQRCLKGTNHKHKHMEIDYPQPVANHEIERPSTKLLRITAKRLAEPGRKLMTIRTKMLPVEYPALLRAGLLPAFPLL